MALEQDIGRLIESTDKLTETVDGKIQEITARLDQKSQEVDSRLAAKEQAVESKIASFQKALPLAPNNLSDTKYFAKINSGHEDGVAVDVMQSHAAPWSCFYHRGTEGTCTVTKLKNTMLEDFNLSPNDNFNRAIGDYFSDAEPFYGSDFRILLLDVNITKGVTSDESAGMLFTLNQGCPTFTGWGRGEFLTQATCWVNVLEQSGTLSFYPSANRSAPIRVGSGDVGKGWQYKHSAMQGWGGCHQPYFRGLGKMKVAIALPYVGTGDHGDNMIWADSVGHPYSHTAPALDEGA